MEDRDRRRERHTAYMRGHNKRPQCRQSSPAMSGPGIRRVSVRYDRAEDAWLMRCDSCAAIERGSAWWELNTDNWDPDSGLQRCRACHNTARRLARRQTPEERRAKQRAYYRKHRRERLQWRRAYHAAHREEINAHRRARYAAAKQSTAP